MDDCAPIAAYISQEKARTAALGRRETKGYEEMVNNGRTAFVTAPLLTSLEGGVPVVVDANYWCRGRFWFNRSTGCAGRESGSSGVSEISENEEINNESNHNPGPFTH